MSSVHEDNTTASFADNATDNIAASLVYTKDQLALIARSTFWWHVIIIPAGIVGNILCLLVMSQKQNRSISCSVYMGALAVADSIQLLTSASFFAVAPWIANLREETIKVMCKVLVYWTFTSSQCGVFLILALLVERVIAVSKPMKAAVLLSPKRALIISFCILIFSAVFNVPFIFITSTNLQGETAAFMPCASDDQASVIHGMAGLVLNGVVPLLGILGMNLKILYVIKSSKYAFGKQKKAKNYFIKKKLPSVSDSVDMTTDTTVETSTDIKAIPQAVDYEDSKITTPDSSRTRESHKVSTDHAETTSSVNSIKTEPSQSDMVNHSKRSPAATTSKARHGQSQRERQLTMMTVVVTLAFLVCTLPKFVHILTFHDIESQSSAVRQIVFGWSGSVAQNLHTLNSAINFYMYVLTGSKCRSDLKNLFRCKKGSLG